MNPRIIIRPYAKEDICDQIRYYDNINPLIARRFADAVAQTIQMLAENPHIGTPYKSKTEPVFPAIRQWRVRGFRHILFYMDGEDFIEIVRVIHGNRNIHRLLEQRDDR